MVSEGSPPSAPAPLLGLVGRGALGVAACIATYLAIASIQSDGVAGCGEGGGCHQVLSSKWASLAGVPVGVLGLLSYVGLLVANLLKMPRTIQVFLGVVIVGAALWFVIVQAAIIKQFCPWCCATHAFASVGALLVVWIGWPKEVVSPAPEPKSKKEKQRAARAAAKGSVMPWAAAGALSVVATGVLQSMAPEKETTVGVQIDSGSNASGAGQHRLLSLHGDEVKIHTAEFPVLGSLATAEHIAVGLFDFTCPHCEELQKIFDQILPEYDGRIAVVKVPGAHKEAGREIHRMMLATWRENPEIYKAAAKELREEFNKPTVQEVQVVLAGHMELDALNAAVEKHRVWADEKIALGEKLLQENMKISKRTTFPQLMLGAHLEIGKNDNLGHYYQLFEKHFGIVRDDAPTLVPEPKEIRMGTVVTGTEHRILFKMRNPGKRPIGVTDVKVPKGMRLESPPPKPPTSAKQGPRVILEIPAGGEGQFVVLATIPVVSGEIAGAFYVYSAAGVAEVKVQADVLKPYSFDPERLDFGDVVGAVPPPRDVELTFDEPVTLGAPIGQTGKFTASISEIEPGRRFVAKIVPDFDLTKPGFKIGRIVFPVKPINSQHRWPKEVSLAVRARVARAK